MRRERAHHAASKRFCMKDQTWDTWTRDKARRQHRMILRLLIAQISMVSPSRGVCLKDKASALGDTGREFVIYILLLFWMGSVFLEMPPRTTVVHKFKRPQLLYLYCVLEILENRTPHPSR